MKNRGSGEKIYECEVKRPHQTDGTRFLKWIRREVSLVRDDDLIRCHECKGKVRLHRKRKPSGPNDHVEHRDREDSEGCSLGYYYLGASKVSLDPVE